MTSTLPVQVHSRRTAMRLVGAGIAITVAGGVVDRAVAAQSTFPARIRVLHAAPGLGKIEVLFNGGEVLDEFEYGTISDWIEVQPGVVRGTIRRDRAGINYVVFDAIAPIVANEDYEMIISDLLVIPAPVDREPLRDNTARVRAIHASVDTPPIDVAIKGDGGRIEEVTSTLKYAERSDALVIPGGAYDIEVRLQDPGDVLLTVPQITLAAGTTSDLVVYGTPGDENAPLAVATLSDEAPAS